MLKYLNMTVTAATPYFFANTYSKKSDLKAIKFLFITT